MLFLLGIASAGYARQGMAPRDTALFKKQVNAQAALLQTLESHFVQTKHLDFMEHDLVSSGKLYFRQPALVRWEYQDPFHYTVVFRKDKMYLDDNGKKKSVDLANSKKLKNLGSLIAGTVQGAGIFDDERFEIAYYTEDKDYRCIFTPKEKELKKYIREISLLFDGTTYMVKHIRMTDPSADYTDIRFSNQKRNSGIPDEKFNVP